MRLIFSSRFIMWAGGPPYSSDTSAFGSYRALDIFHLALTIQAVYVYIVTNWGNMAGIEYISWYGWLPYTFNLPYHGHGSGQVSKGER